MALQPSLSWSMVVLSDVLGVSAELGSLMVLRLLAGTPRPSPRRGSRTPAFSQGELHGGQAEGQVLQGGVGGVVDQGVHGGGGGQVPAVEDPVAGYVPGVEPLQGGDQVVELSLRDHDLRPLDR